MRVFFLFLVFNLYSNTMKSIIIYFLLAIPFYANSQAVQKNNIEIAAGVGVGIYGTSSNDSSADNSMAAAGLLHISLQYAISEKFSTGLFFERNGFITERDSSNKGVSLNTGLDVQFRVLNSEKTTIFFNIAGAYSHFRYDDFSSNSWVSGNGLSIQPGIGFRHYFSKTIGMFFQSSYASYNYKKLADAKGNILQTSHIADKKDLHIKISGLNLKLGLTFKF